MPVNQKNEPQLSAEMEAKLKAWSEQDNGGDFVTEGYGYYEELKHFLATALEEQRASMIAEIESWLDVAPAMTLTNPANNHPANAYKLIDKAELRAKLVEMKGETV